MSDILMTNDASFASVDEFLDACVATTGHDWADHAREMIDWWQSQGGQVRTTRTGAMLDRPYGAPTPLALLTLSVKGTGEIGTLKFKRHGLLIKVLAELRAMGFHGEQKLTYTADDLATGMADQAKAAVTLMNDSLAFTP